MGIVGMPNVGKSTLFNVMTKCSIPAENFPFCTIDPNNVRGSRSPPSCAEAGGGRFFRPLSAARGHAPGSRAAPCAAG